MLENAKSSKDIHTRIQRRLNLLDQGRYMSLVDYRITDDREVGSGNQLRASPESWEECAAQYFNHMLLYGHLRQAVVWDTGR